MEMNEHGLQIEGMPLYQKGLEILELVTRICELIPDEAEEGLIFTGQEMMTNAYMLTVKIAGAEAAHLYDLKMEAAAIIRKAARDLMVQKHALEMFDFQYPDYFDMVRDLIEEYRLLFIDWVSKFDKWDYVIDRWGLFNPPGVGPFDKDPDEDIPFNGFDEDQ